MIDMNRDFRLWIVDCGLRACIFSFIFFAPFFPQAQNFTKEEISRWRAQAQRVTIIRDNFGVPHIYGKTDADCVFGLLYAQCEDDFKRVEANYIDKLGRWAEIKGESSLYEDLFIRLVIDSAEAVADFKKTPPAFQKLLSAYSDGVNYFLYTHPDVHPQLLARFKPWYALLWTDGSISAINSADITEADVKNFYGNVQEPISIKPYQEKDHLSGSNGFSIAPSRSASGNALLYINPHVTFYFRAEVSVQSEEGLHAYGAVTWGQFFVYQGFNEHCGWMHTTNNVDVADTYIEKVSRKNGKLYYLYNKQQLPVKERKYTLYVNHNGSVQPKTITAYFTHHGPIMARKDGNWISLRAVNRSLNGLQQSWERTKAKNFEEFKKIMTRRSNASNSTTYADDHGHIAYWHGNFVPKRDLKYNWSVPVDGTIPETEWKGLHAFDETVHVYDPAIGYTQNCNSSPFSSAGENSPIKKDYPGYMAPDGENFRGLNAARVLSREKAFTIDKLIAAGYDRYLTAFPILIPALTKSFSQLPSTDADYAETKEAVDLLAQWDDYSAENSVATTLAVEWAQKLNPAIRRVYIDAGEVDQVSATKNFAANATSAELITPLKQALAELKQKFGTWKLPWGELNRYQRLTGELTQTYDDSKPSLPVGFTSSLWGMLPAYSTNYFPGAKKRYGIGGNSFICAVEFGKKVKAKSLLAGGESGNPNSPHFGDQAKMYTQGIFKEVLFYKEDVEKHVEKKYHPGE